MLEISAQWVLGLVLGGIVLLLVAAALEALWDFGRHVRPELCPAFLQSGWRHVILAGCVILLLASGTMLFLVDFRVGLGAIVFYFLLLPIVVGSRVRKRFLPPWEDLKAELEKEGYTEQTYWRLGDWWKVDRKSKPESGSKSKSEK